MSDAGERVLGPTGPCLIYRYRAIACASLPPPNPASFLCLLPVIPPLQPSQTSTYQPGRLAQVMKPLFKSSNGLKKYGLVFCFSHCVQRHTESLLKRALTNLLLAFTGRACITNFSIPPTFLLSCQDFKAITAQLQANYTIKKREWYHPTVILWRTTELFFDEGKSVSALLHNEILMISAGEIPIRSRWKRGIPSWEHAGKPENFSCCALWLN